MAAVRSRWSRRRAGMSKDSAAMLRASHTVLPNRAQNPQPS
jgi:hypothetical protein